VPVFFQNMQQVSTKTGHFHPVGGLRKVEVHFGEAIAPEKYLAMRRPEFLEFIRWSIAGAAGVKGCILSEERIELSANSQK
jgi:hypothetical protein